MADGSLLLGRVHAVEDVGGDLFVVVRCRLPNRRADAALDALVSGHLVEVTIPERSGHQVGTGHKAEGPER